MMMELLSCHRCVQLLPMIMTYDGVTMVQNFWRPLKIHVTNRRPTGFPRTPVLCLGCESLVARVVAPGGHVFRESCRQCGAEHPPAAAERRRAFGVDCVVWCFGHQKTWDGGWSTTAPPVPGGMVWVTGFKQQKLSFLDATNGAKGIATRSKDA